MQSRASIGSNWRVAAWPQLAKQWLPAQCGHPNIAYSPVVPTTPHSKETSAHQHPAVAAVASCSCYPRGTPTANHGGNVAAQCKLWVQYQQHSLVAAAVGNSKSAAHPSEAVREDVVDGSSHDMSTDMIADSATMFGEGSPALPAPDNWSGMVASWPKQTLSPGLYVVPTPIGNLADISLRALLTLHSANLVLAEDTRHTRKLLTHYGIRAHTLSYHEHNERTRVPALIQRLQQGEPIALVSDAGMPGISDPGHTLIQAAVAAGVQVIPLPGACAFLCALVASGLDTTQFTFAGFLPPKQGARQQRLRELQTTVNTLAFYVSPHSLRATLADMVTVFGPRRRVCVARELTKKFEELLRTDLQSALQTFTDREPRGEFCVIVEGAQQSSALEQQLLGLSHLATPVQNVQPTESVTVDRGMQPAGEGPVISEQQAVALMQQLVEQGIKLSDAAKAVARQLGLKKKDMYALAVSAGLRQG